MPKKHKQRNSQHPIHQLTSKLGHTYPASTEKETKDYIPISTTLFDGISHEIEVLARTPALNFPYVSNKEYFRNEEDELGCNSLISTAHYETPSTLVDIDKDNVEIQMKICQLLLKMKSSMRMEFTNLFHQMKECGYMTLSRQSDVAIPTTMAEAN